MGSPTVGDEEEYEPSRFVLQQAGRTSWDRLLLRHHQLVPTHAQLCEVPHGSDRSWGRSCIYAIPQGPSVLEC
jgi:hypothetical protein